MFQVYNVYTLLGGDNKDDDDDDDDDDNNNNNNNNKYETHFTCDITLHHHQPSQLGLDRPVSASSNSLFKGLPNRLRPFGLQISLNFGILLLFILVKCRSLFDLYLLSFWSACEDLRKYIIP